MDKKPDPTTPNSPTPNPTPNPTPPKARTWRRRRYCACGCGDSLDSGGNDGTYLGTCLDRFASWNRD